ncbi:YqkE family protein [Bacillus sp. 03113]|uniref:YqkE family protein n=1 Tax=Bacillus sp. 03113 TaxID=2578211 RepID=UPI0011413E00|nr:YqkE family protein [Bacillus sp. 03113]
MKKRQKAVKNDDKPVTLGDALGKDLMQKLKDTKAQLKAEELQKQKEEEERKREEKRMKEKNKSFEELLNESSFNWKDFK